MTRHCANPSEQTCLSKGAAHSAGTHGGGIAPYFSDPVALAELLEAQVRRGLNPTIQATCPTPYLQSLPTTALCVLGAQPRQVLQAGDVLVRVSWHSCSILT